MGDRNRSVHLDRHHWERRFLGRQVQPKRVGYSIHNRTDIRWKPAVNDDWSTDDDKGEALIAVTNEPKLQLDEIRAEVGVYLYPPESANTVRRRMIAARMIADFEVQASQAPAAAEQAALVAEHRFGVLRGTTDCAYITWSTGIGVGLMLDGQLLRGKSGNAGHAGHSVVPSRSSPLPQCGCGNEGDVESLAGGASLARRWGADTESLFDAWRAGDARAAALVDQAIDAVADLIYNLVVTLDIDHVAIGGGLFCAQADRLLHALRARVAASGRRPGMRSMVEPLRIAAVDDPRRTAELGALSLVIPADWNAFAAEPMALHS